MTGQVAAAKVMCPRCKHVWWVEPGESEVLCNCHMFCDDGFKPEDCNLIWQTPTAKRSVTLSWPLDAQYPTGQHNFSPDYGDDRTHRTNYCTVHGKFTYKTPVLIPLPGGWERWSNERCEKKFRQIYQTTGT
jgi:hypothetical protein